MYYAQINANGIVYAITQTSGIVVLSSMIQIESFDESLIGKKYENGQFVTVEE
jgi:hypothetical protein